MPSSAARMAGDQLDRRRVLEHEARRPGLERAPREGHVPVHGEEHHGHAVAVLPQPDQGVDAVEVGHGDVGDDDVRPQCPGRLDQRAPVLHHAHQVELGREQALQRLGHQEMVVGEEHARTARGGSSRASFRREPRRRSSCPGRARSRCRACRSPAARARACSPGRGSVPVSGLSGSKPTPSSRTARSSPPSICRSVTLAARAPAWRATLLSASCATRNRQSAASFADDGGQRVELHRELEPRPAPEPFAFRPQRLGQAELLEDRRVQLVRQGVDVLAEAHEPLAHRPHRLGLRPVRRGELGAADVDRQHGEPLRHVVVQLAREQRALLLLGPDQAPAQIAQLVLGALALRDVAEDAERADRASVGVARWRRGRGGGSTARPASGAGSDTRGDAAPAARRAAAGACPAPAGGRRDADAPSRTPAAARPCSRSRRQAADVAEPVVDVRGALVEVAPRRTRGRRARRPTPGVPRWSRSASSACLPLGDVDGRRPSGDRGSPVAVRLRPPAGCDPAHAALGRSRSGTPR